MYPMFRKTVETLITNVAGVPLEDFYREENQYVAVQKPNYDDLMVLKNGRVIKVGYYRKGDAKPDPVFTFQIDEAGNWCPIRLEQVLGKREIGVFEDGRYYFSKGRFRDAKSFASSCAREWKEYYL